MRQGHAAGHPQYPVIAYKAAQHRRRRPSHHEAIPKDLKVPLDSNSSEARRRPGGARYGSADMILGIYYNGGRATFFDYVKPAFMFDDVAIFVAKGKEFSFKGQNDLVSRRA